MSASCTVRISDDEWASIRTNIGVALGFAILACIAAIGAAIGVSDLLSPDQKELDLTLNQFAMICVAAVLCHTLATAFAAEANRIMSVMAPLDSPMDATDDEKQFDDARTHLSASVWVSVIPLAGPIAIVVAAIKVLGAVDTADIREVVYRPVRDALA